MSAKRHIIHPVAAAKGNKGMCIKVRTISVDSFSSPSTFNEFNQVVDFTSQMDCNYMDPIKAKPNCSAESILASISNEGEPL